MARLLVVDDDLEHLKMWRIVLEGAGHQIETADTLEQAVAGLDSLPEVLVMDLRLPELRHGLTLIRQAATREGTKIIVLSGWPLDLEAQPEAKLVARLLAKPARPPALLRAIAELTISAGAPSHNPQPAGR